MSKQGGIILYSKVYPSQVLPAQSLLLNIQELPDPSAIDSLKLNDGRIHTTKFCKCILQMLQTAFSLPLES